MVMEILPTVLAVREHAGYTRRLSTGDAGWSLVKTRP